MHLRKSTIGAVAALALIPGTALAATIDGGPGNDRLRGTHDADLINGHAGNGHKPPRNGKTASARAAKKIA